MHTDRFCITQVAATVDALLGVPCHGGAAAPLPPVLHQAARSLAAPCDRVFLYNPDAIAQWIYAGHRPLFAPLEVRADLGLDVDTFINTSYQWIDSSNIENEEYSSYFYG